MIEGGATHLGVAIDHVIESFRNELWAGYKTGEGIEPALRAQFHPLEEGLAAMGVAVWPMLELEADDALAAAARLAAEDARVARVCIWANDKDLAQCVRGERVVQVDRCGKHIRNAEGVREKFGVPPELIPDFLALVGDAQDGYPGIVRWPLRPWRRPTVDSSLRHGASRLVGRQATNPASSASGHHASLARLPGQRLPSSAPDSDGSVPAGAASPRDLCGPGGRVRPHGSWITGMGRARLPRLLGVRHSGSWLRPGPL
jgi:hypothetical protein